MSIGFRLLAQFEQAQKRPEEALARIEQWFGSRCADLVPSFRTGVVDANPTLFCQFHPAGEEVEFSFLDERRFIVTANTSSVGPGYHILLCDMLHEMGESLVFTWQDPDSDAEYGDEAGY